MLDTLSCVYISIEARSMPMNTDWRCRNLMYESVTEKRLCWSLGELAAATGLSVGPLRNEVRRGALRIRRIGRRVIVLNEDWEKYVRSK